jgi:hypothetical protein
MAVTPGCAMAAMVPVSGIGWHGAERNCGARDGEKKLPHRDLLPMK